MSFVIRNRQYKKIPEYVLTGMIHNFFFICTGGVGLVHLEVGI